MLFQTTIPTNKLQTPSLEVRIGQILFILGANGTGKSSLMQNFAMDHQGKSRRIAAHRQNWLESGVPELSSKQRLDYEVQISFYDQQAASRYMDNIPGGRIQATIFDLVNAENLRARKIAHAVDERNDNKLEKFKAEYGVFTILNRLLHQANLDISISISKNDEIIGNKK